ncbi:MAG: class I SAM-dependent methyltransferase [Acidimicrobiales bacterium]
MDEPTVAVYEGHVEEWLARRGGPRDDLGERFRRHVGSGPVLDAGCGPGRYLGQLGRPVVGVDATAGLLAAARRRADAPLVRGDLEALPFSEGVFAGVFARHSYLHLRKELLVPALRDAARVLRPGGHLFLSLVRGSYEGRSLPGDDFPGRWFSCWEPGELAAALAVAGFVHVEVEDGNGPRQSTDIYARASAH